MTTSRGDAHGGYEIPCKDYHGKNIILEVRFNHCYYLFGTDVCESRWITYCAIHPKGSAQYYFGGAALNPHDHNNERVGEVVAYKRALRQRWEEVHKDRSGYTWKQYSSKFRLLLHTARNDINGHNSDQF